MIHRERQWHSCDRCGRRIEDYEMIPFSGCLGGVREIFRDIFDKKTMEEMATLNAKIVEGPYGRITDKYLIGKKILCMKIYEYYDCKTKEIHLCGKCRKAFEKFLRNEDGI